MAAKLEGEWQGELAGKRMKLPVPETWETQISLHGNYVREFTFNKNTVQCTVHTSIYLTLFQYISLCT